MPPTPGLAHAYLNLAEITSSATGATTAGASLGSIPFQFNPQTFQIVKEADWKSKSAAGSKTAPPAQYMGAKPQSISLEMFLDACDDPAGDVSTSVQMLVDACVPTDSSMGKSRPVPPAVTFGWDKVYFVGYLEKVTAVYTLFRSDGTPIRAKCTIELKELPQTQPAQNPTSGALSAMASRQLLEGDSLAGIAYAEYGDPTLWRLIAEANDVDDPMAIVAGRHLLIPSATGSR